MTDHSTQILDDKLRAETAKLIAEAGHLKMQTLVAPFLAAAGVIGATAAFTAAFISWLGA